MWRIGGHTGFYCQKDLATGQCHAVPFKSKSARSMTRIMGWTIADDSARKFYAPRRAAMHTDSYTSLINAAESNNLIPVQSLPGVPESNGVIESLNRMILSGMRKALASSGSPACWWPFAAQYAAFLRKLQINPEGMGNPYRERFGREFGDPTSRFGRRYLIHLHRPRNWTSVIKAIQ